MTDAQHIAAILAALGAAYTACGILVMLWHIYNGR